MTTPIMKTVSQYIEKNPVRMHMPGHKGNLKGIFGEISEYDLTEVTGLDSLFECDGCIEECEKQYADIYGSNKTCISAAGSTLCIQAMLAVAGEEGKKVIAGRNIHKSAVNAMGLLGLEPIWIYPEGKSGRGIPGVISPEKIEKALCENRDVCAVYITTPDYFGVLSDVKAISQICHRYDVPLLVDNAHGAGLKFAEKSLHPMDLGADMCCDSLHKTMPVFTAGALLHIGNEKYAEKAKWAMGLFGSTSPSYLVMETIDMTLEYINSGRAKSDFQKIASYNERMRKLLAERGFEIPSGILDPAKLAFSFSSMGYTAEEFYEILKKHNIEQEYMSDNYCVFMPTGFNSEEDLKAVENLIRTTPKKGEIPVRENFFVEAEQGESLRKAMLGKKTKVKTAEAEGRIAAETCSKCPPGIPLLIPGEKITKKMIKYLNTYSIFEINVV